MPSRKNYRTIGGKISLLTTILGVGIILVGLLGDLPHGNVARANTATTSVTVLNTPPQWDTNVYAYESPASASSTPTNVGSTVTWVASSTDSSNDNYYLLICNNYASPTPNASAAPTCSGGNANRIALSAATVSGTQATAATTTVDSMVEVNYWYAYICDGAAIGPACNVTAWNGSTTPNITGVAAHSPYLVNHRPVFTSFLSYSAAAPGATFVWYSTSSDPDTYGGTSPDTVRLLVCRAADFSGSTCGAGGSWATSSYVTTNASTTFTIPTPYTKGYFGAYGYITDSHGGFAASGGSQGTNASLVVSNVTPSISSSSVSLLDTDGAGPLTLTGMATQTAGFSVQYTVSDQNSCRTASSTDEINSGLTNVFRSGVGSTSCQIAGDYNANNCYPFTAGVATWNVSCVASSTSCLGTTDSDVIWTCTFPLWFVADATDGNGVPATDPPNFAQNWLTTVQGADTSLASTSLVEMASGTGVELTSFLAYSVSTTTIAYGGLQPGQDTGTVGNTALDRTDLRAAGNVGMDETLYGVDMCPGYPAACSGNATSTIFVANQKYGTSTLAYASAIALLASPGAELEVNVKKTTSTSTLQATTTYWGIAVPAAITLSGDYLGMNTIVALTGERADW